MNKLIKINTLGTNESVVLAKELMNIFPYKGPTKIHTYTDDLNSVFQVWIETNTVKEREQVALFVGGEPCTS